MPSFPPPYFRAHRRHSIAEGLLTPDHIQRIGPPALVTFLWCIFRQTKPDGSVLNGRCISTAQIASDLGFCTKTTQRHLQRLSDHGYISLLRLQRGLVITVCKNRKFWGSALAADRTKVSTQHQNATQDRTSSASRVDTFGGGDRTGLSHHSLYVYEVDQYYIHPDHTKQPRPNGRYPYRDRGGGIHFKTRTDLSAYCQDKGIDPNDPNHRLYADSEDG